MYILYICFSSCFRWLILQLLSRFQAFWQDSTWRPKTLTIGVCMNQHVNHFFCQSLVSVILDGNNTLMTFWSISSILIQILSKKPLQFLVSKSKKEKNELSPVIDPHLKIITPMFYISFTDIDEKWVYYHLNLKRKKKKKQRIFYFTYLSHLEIKSELFLYYTIHKLAS